MAPWLAERQIFPYTYRIPMLSQAFIDDAKAKLEKEKVRLQGELKGLATEDPKKPGHFIASYDETGSDSEDDNSIEITNYVDEMSLVQRLDSEYRDVLKALAAIEKGTYGTCKYCRKEIDIKRLEARLTSSTCIACKKLLTQEL